jgi:hypothetical protein
MIGSGIFPRSSSSFSETKRNGTGGAGLIGYRIRLVSGTVEESFLLERITKGIADSPVVLLTSFVGELVPDARIITLKPHGLNPTRRHGKYRRSSDLKQT